MAPEPSAAVREIDAQMDRLKRQLLAPETSELLLQGSLLKRSDKLRVWNERWVALDLSIGKMEYKSRESDSAVRGTIAFDSTSTITVSTQNFYGVPGYDGCCFYIATAGKQEYIFCAETPRAARAWVSALLATQLVLRAHNEKVNASNTNEYAMFGKVAVALAVANSTAVEASKELQAARKRKTETNPELHRNKPDDHQDHMKDMLDSLGQKDDELHELSMVLRTRDSTIKKLADRLKHVAEASEGVAASAHSIDDQLKLLRQELQDLKKDTRAKLDSSLLKESEEKVMILLKEKEFLLRQRDSVLKEASTLRSDLGRERGSAIIFEAAVVRAEEKARIAEVNAESCKNGAMEVLHAAIEERGELLALLWCRQSQISRWHMCTEDVGDDERTEQFFNDEASTPITKHVDLAGEGIVKAWPTDSTPIFPIEEATRSANGADILPSGGPDFECPKSIRMRIPDAGEERTGTNEM